MQNILSTVYIETPQGLGQKFRTKKIPLSAMYDSGFFVSEIFGTEAWVIDSHTYEAQTKYILSPLTDEIYRAIKDYAAMQYKRFCYLVDNHIGCFAD